MSQEAANPRHSLARWIAEQWALFVLAGMVVGISFWIAWHAVMVSIVVACLAFVIGCVAGTQRFVQWLAAGDDGKAG